MTSKTITTLFLLLAFLSCSDEPATETYSGKSFEVDYRFVEKLEDQSWIKIDTVKFRHLRDRELAENSDFILPASEVVFDSLETGKTLRSRVNSASIPMYLSRSFLLINSSLESQSRLAKSYVVPDPSLGSVTGRFIIQKKDSSVFSIEVPADYPAQINILSN